MGGEVSEDEPTVEAANAADTQETAAAKRKRKNAVERPFPRRALADCIKIAAALKDKNGGEPWPSEQVAAAVGASSRSSTWYYWSAAARDFGLTEGTRETATIALRDLGKAIVYAASAEAEAQAKRDAFLSVDLFRRVLEHYKGSKLPEKQYLTNTLTTTFGLHPEVHAEFIELFQANARYVGIGNDFDAPGPASEITVERQPATTSLRTSKEGDPVCFVIMPFVERSDAYPTGFFAEVYESIIRPATENAGFVVKTAKRQGSDVIQATIINELLNADLVVADLTEHNPNVLFELGMRMHADLPVALIRAKGTGAIFDVDNMLRVEDYNPNLWPSTVEKDVPRIMGHVLEAWENRATAQTFMKILRSNA
jgi:hypothetical protein